MASTATGDFSPGSRAQPEAQFCRRHRGRAAAKLDVVMGREHRGRPCESPKAGLVPTECNLLPAYSAFAAVVEACDHLFEEVNGHEHRESRRVPAEALQEALMHRLPLEP